MEPGAARQQSRVGRRRRDHGQTFNPNCLHKSPFLELGGGQGQRGREEVQGCKLSVLQEDLVDLCFESLNSKPYHHSNHFLVIELVTHGTCLIIRKSEKHRATLLSTMRYTRRVSQPSSVHNILGDTNNHN